MRHSLVMYACAANACVHACGAHLKCDLQRMRPHLRACSMDAIRARASLYRQLVDHVPVFLHVLRGRTACAAHACLRRRYIVQDHKYLFAYGSVLNTLAARAPTRELASFFTSSAANILGTEVTLHVGLLEKWGLSEADVEAAPMQPACLMYTSYLQNICNTRPFFEGVPPLWVAACATCVPECGPRRIYCLANQRSRALRL